MPAFIDHTGETHGRLTVVRRDKQRRRVHWICKCECGNETVVDAQALRSGHTTSCGCRQKTTRLSHGAHTTVEYGIWIGMRARCRCQTDKRYKDYGGRGITVSPEWDSSFPQFLRDMGERPTRHHSIDRIDNDGPYAAWNCRWATSTQQARSRRSTTRLTYRGKTMCATDWARELGVGPHSVQRWVRLGKSIEEIVTYYEAKAGVA